MQVRAPEQDAPVVSVVAEVEALLTRRGCAGPRRLARDLVAAVLGEPRSWPAIHADTLLAPGVVGEIRRAAARLAAGTPFAYAVGRADFRHLVLAVDERVLIPRPETELLVELVLESPQAREGGVAADVGTGSGAIALALAAEGDFARVIATDVSADALDVARTNRASFGEALRAPVDFRLGASLAPLAGERLDVLVSNPPYISFAELEALPAAVRDWEPTVALVCPEDGLTVIRTLAREGAHLLRPGGLLALEVDSRRALRVAQIVRDTGAFTAPIVHRDLTGRDRFVLATRRTAHHA